jgi:hypothetical protein
LGRAPGAEILAGLVANDEKTHWEKVALALQPTHIGSQPELRN